MTTDEDLVTWESEALVRAGAWILLFRGAGTGVASAMILRIFLDVGRAALYPTMALATGCVLTAAGLGALRRRRWSMWAAALGILAWGGLLVLPWVQSSGFRPVGLSLVGAGASLPWMTLLPALYLPEVFALHAFTRRGGRATLEKRRPRLASLFCGGGWRRTGRGLVAVGMLVLSWLTMAVTLLLAPGLVPA